MTNYELDTNMLNNLLMETREIMVELRTDLKRLREDVEGLVHVVRDGNGERSLVARVIDLENIVKGLAEKRSTRVALFVAVAGSVVSWGAVLIDMLVRG